jgi:hypothetical protein
LTKNDNIPEFQELMEVDAMLAETITEWTEQWMAQGEAKGEVKGRIEEKFNMIKRLYNFNMPLDQIAVVVNLSIDKIKKSMKLVRKALSLFKSRI